MLPLHRDGVLLVFPVGSDVIHLGHSTWEGRPSAADVEGVFVDVCFVHAVSMAHPAGFGSSPWYRTAEENLKVACANQATGQAAALSNI